MDLRSADYRDVRGLRAAHDEAQRLASREHHMACGASEVKDVWTHAIMQSGIKRAAPITTATEYLGEIRLESWKRC
jgi:hypothetical protein